MYSSIFRLPLIVVIIGVSPLSFGPSFALDPEKPIEDMTPQEKKDFDKVQIDWIRSLNSNSEKVPGSSETLPTATNNEHFLDSASCVKHDRTRCQSSNAEE